MSLAVHFEPHSWYRGFAIQRNNQNIPENIAVSINRYEWTAVTDNGNTYQVDTIEADTLKELKEKIAAYRMR
jgi:hypothetical protein